ncbi:MAG: hypothetical protein CVT77_03470 [Alphaproteobacteria bacterium HGW-Alphaproteobacteria-16]|nr:MAG: hypothetical protein CVT77_03470 [Alphaproteobacteria bacterium HGW-Alphaproteobacteria-16]
MTVDDKNKEILASLTVAVRETGPASVDPILSLLSSQEEEIVRLRYGFGRTQIGTYRQLGEVVGLSASRVAQIHDKAFRRMRWFIGRGGPVGSPALASYANQKRQEAVEDERLRQIQDEERLAEIERKREEKIERADRRRARARKSLWQRKLSKAIADQVALEEARIRLDHRIAKLERRGWLTRTVLPHDSVLGKLRDERSLLDGKIREMGLAIVALRSALPD